MEVRCICDDICPECYPDKHPANLYENMTDVTNVYENMTGVGYVVCDDSVEKIAARVVELIREDIHG